MTASKNEAPQAEGTRAGSAGGFRKDQNISEQGLTASQMPNDS